MKTLFVSLILVFLGVSAFSATEAEIIDKLKEIDSKMTQGTVSFMRNIKKDAPVPKGKPIITIAYDDQGRFKNEIKSHDPSKKFHALHYMGDKYFISSFPNTKDIAIADKSMLDINFPFRSTFDFWGISTYPSLQYGRGLTLLKDLKVDPYNNQAVGILNGLKIVAYLDPKLDYAAYKIERIHPYPNMENDTIENSKPILVDGKYYIYSESTLTYATDRIKPDTSRIVSATFAKPAKKDYIFDWKNNPFEYIEDYRGTKKQDFMVKYKRADLPKDITPEQLLTRTKRTAPIEQTKMSIKKFLSPVSSSEDNFTMDKGSLMRIVISLAAIILLIAFIKRRKMNNNH